VPSTVVAASCDSAFQADVLVPGGSFAQALHLIGIPLVVASQFPLTYDGSIRLAEAFYHDVLWGKHPLPAIASVRAALHAEFGNTHDWASLVAYDALPTDLDDQLEEIQYYRARYAIDDTLHELDQHHGKAEDAAIDEATKRAEPALDSLPTSPKFAMEVGGLRGSYAKRVSEHLFNRKKYSEARQQLEIAQREYRDAANRFYSTGASYRASLNWLETQSMSLAWILGGKAEPGSWEIAMRSCKRDLADGDWRARAWAHGSMAELYLLQLFSADRRRASRIERAAKQHVAELLEYYPRASDFPVFSTRRQFNRYVEWWGSAEFVRQLGPGGDTRSPRWAEVSKLAAELVAILDSAIQDDDGAGDVQG
jgi:hypothetical protein